MLLRSSDRDSLFFSHDIFSCLPVSDSKVASDVFNFNHANFPTMKADSINQSINKFIAGNTPHKRKNNKQKLIFSGTQATEVIFPITK